MNRFFEHYEFLEFFNKEEILDKELGWYKYTLYLENDFVFELSMITLEADVSIVLRQENCASPLLDIDFNGIDKIVLEKTTHNAFLKLYKESQKQRINEDLEPFLRIMIKPSVSLHLSL